MFPRIHPANVGRPSARPERHYIRKWLLAGSAGGSGLAATQAVTVYQVTGSTYYSESREGAVFAVDGLPQQLNGPITITFDVPGEPLMDGTTYILQVEGNGLGGQVFAEATVNGSQVTATFEPAVDGAVVQAGYPAARLASGSLRGIDNTGALRMYELLGEYVNRTSPKNMFELIYSERVWRPILDAEVRTRDIDCQDRDPQGTR